VGLLGRRQATGHAFHIVSDEAMTWDEIHRQTAAAAGVECRIVHIPTDFIAACRPEMERPADRRRRGLRGLRQQQDQAVRAGIPAGACPTPRASSRRSPGSTPILRRQEVDTEMDDWMDRLIAAYELGLTNARAAFDR
jgi:hypothetical protein